MTTDSWTTSEDTPGTLHLEPDENLINLSLSWSDEIIQKLEISKNKQQETHIYDGPVWSHTGVLVQWDWRAVYNPPNYPYGYDSIVVKNQRTWEKYILPWTYGKKEKENYLLAVKAWQCNTHEGKNDWTFVLINWVYYMPPTTMQECSFHQQPYLVELTPEKKYLEYSYLVGEAGYNNIIIDVASQKKILEFVDWIWSMEWIGEDLLFLAWWNGSGGGWFPEDYIVSPEYTLIPGSLFLKREGTFHGKTVIQTLIKWASVYNISADRNYIYALSDEDDYSYFKVLEMGTYREVYSRAIRAYPWAQLYKEP
jgi:hypothetical protein